MKSGYLQSSFVVIDQILILELRQACHFKSGSRGVTPQPASKPAAMGLRTADKESTIEVGAHESEGA